jgi:malonyl-CoA/methylmalonyl-CoA synthetase
LTRPEPRAQQPADRDRPAIVSHGRTTTHGELAGEAGRAAEALLGGRQDLEGARVAFLMPPGAEWTSVLLGIWRAGGMAVPLAAAHPAAELEHVISDCGASIVVADPAAAPMLAPLATSARARFIEHRPSDIDHRSSDDADERWPTSDERCRAPAMILYTSGTTGNPKGVVLTHANLDAQVASLLEAWEWTSADRTLLVLPLHHVHGIVNVVLSALRAGAICEMPPRFDAAQTWARMASGEITLFTAVPTIYHRLIAAWDAAPPEQQRAWSDGAHGLRLMMSGSAALPVSVLERWREITGHTLLERYGMTEIGMGLSNPLRGTRRPGFVGAPLPGVEAQVVGDDGRPVDAGAAGELQIRGAGVFNAYWQRPAETQAAFRDGWFRTGDVAVVEDGAYRLLGRTSTDILKVGGHKISALEIEEVMRQHPAITECAVVGLPDDEWGERVAMAAEVRAGRSLALVDLQSWAKPLLANYKLPRELRCVDALPRNAMGKIVKPRVAALFASESDR